MVHSWRRCSDFDLDELAQLARQHAGADDLSRPAYDETRKALEQGKASQKRTQNSYQINHNGVRVMSIKICLGVVLLTTPERGDEDPWERWMRSM